MAVRRTHALADLVGAARPPTVSAHANESQGVNAIPQAFADVLGRHRGWPVDEGIVQVNVVAHTGAGGYVQLARQAAFDRAVEHGRRYVPVDEFVGLGGRLANLRGNLESSGGVVLADVALTGKPYSARLAVSPERLRELKARHGNALETW